MTLRGDQCRCTACGALFTTTRNFDKHRVGKYPQRACRPPNESGLVQNARGFWHKPNKGHVFRTGKTQGGDSTEGRYGGSGVDSYTSSAGDRQ